MTAAKRFLCALPCLFLLGCSCANAPSPSRSPSARPSPATVSAAPGGAQVKLPEDLAYNEEGIPVLKIYVTETGRIEQMDMETYLAGVVAGEMQPDWPEEALRAQALLARSFALRFLLEEGSSKYQGADLSTDVEEAQAYDAESVNDAVRSAVRATRGLVVTDERGIPIRAWFHSHSGGMTATAKEGLDYEEDEPAYIRSVAVSESEDAPQDTQQWTAEFTTQEVNAALASLGGGDASALAIEETGPSGRVTVFSAGKKRVPAVALRLALGGTRMRSTLLTELRVKGGQVRMSGKGYGHGVGMSQWGAYALASQGKSAEEILHVFFQGISLRRAWGLAEKG